jgi:hypothetical protein
VCVPIHCVERVEGGFRLVVRSDIPGWYYSVWPSIVWWVAIHVPGVLAVASVFLIEGEVAVGGFRVMVEQWCMVGPSLGPVRTLRT